MKRFKWYRKLLGGLWYKHQFAKDAEELTFSQGETWWARYGKINRYSDVVKIEKCGYKVKMNWAKRLAWILWVCLYLIIEIVGVVLWIPFWIITGRNYWIWLMETMDNVKGFDEIFNNLKTE